MWIMRLCYALIVFVVGLAFNGAIFAQSSSFSLSAGGNRKRIESSGLIDYAVGKNEGIIIRSSNFNRSTSEALKEHLFFGIQKEIDRALTSTEQENAQAEINRYTRDMLRSVEIQDDWRSSQAALVVVRSELGGEERQSFARDIARRMFDSKNFETADAEEKWRLLQRKVQEEALRPSMKITNGNVELETPVSVVDIIRQVGSEQLGQLFDVESWPESDWLGQVTAQVVAPGTAVSGNGEFTGSCRGSWCGSPAPGAIPVEDDEEADAENFGRAKITYRKDAYSHVVVLQPGRIAFAKDVERCTATLIARNWAVTALHCFGVQGRDIRNSFDSAKGPVHGWLELTAGDEAIFAVGLRKKDENAKAFLVEQIYVPYVDVRDLRYGKGEIPPKDVALVKIAGGKETEFSSYPQFATESASKKDAAVTFVGYGWTDVAREDWTKSQEVAFNWLTKSDTSELLWKTKNFGGNGGPCSGDSGGPIFLDFLRGYADETQRIVGVVSGLRGIGKIGRAADCLEKQGEGEPVFTIASDICAIINDESERCP